MRFDSRRLIAALVAALVTLAFVGPLAFRAYADDRDNARQDTYLQARSRIDDTLIGWRTDTTDMPGNVWVAIPDDGFWEPVGQTWTTPQVLTLTDPVKAGGELIREYEFDGKWLAVSQYVGERTVILTVIGRDKEAEDISRVRLQWLAVALGASLLGGLIAYALVGRMRKPIQRAHDVNRDFIADAAHELRTPLSIIQASAGHALARDRQSVEYRESLEEILIATERAGASVGELLEFARMEAGQAQPRIAPLRLDLLSEEVASAVRVDGATIEARVGQPVVVEADYNLIRQVVDNLVRNAAARAEKVVITTAREEGFARIDIADDGPGFDPGIIDHVFDRFKRGDRSGSAGLGMAIARSMVELHGGKCSAKNQASGGALVTVRLPYQPNVATR